MKRVTQTLLLWILCLSGASAKQLMTLNDAIAIAQRESYAAKMADFSFMSGYWSFRSYEAGWLPSLKLSGNLMNYNRSIVETRDYETGKVAYVDNNSFYNSMSLSINQALPWADGTVSLQSDLSRLDQFNYDLTNYNSTPLLLYYNQPLRRYSSRQWLKKAAPLRYEQAKRSFMENMQTITINVTRLYFNALSAQSDLKQAKAKYNDLEALYGKTQRKHALGTVMKNEVLQLELTLLNAKMSISNYALSLENALFNLFSYMHLYNYDNLELAVPYGTPEVELSVDDVIEKAYANSNHSVAQDLTLLNAEQEVASTKANTGLQVSMYARVGLTQSAATLQGVYGKQKDNEVVGLTFSVPLYDWGLNRGKLRMAKAELELARTQALQDDLEFVQDIRTTVMQFNNQAEQCNISKRALEIAEERYEITMRRYENGSLAVSDLNDASNELEQAQVQYLAQLKTFWVDYYSIQKLTLYNYLRNENLDYDFERIVQ